LIEKVVNICSTGGKIQKNLHWVKVALKSLHTLIWMEKIDEKDES